MENWIFEYIEFLLPKHNCVIIPNFGGFIVNLEPSFTLNGSNTISSPKYNIVFNQELKHDDGLLASSIQTAKNISYQAACNAINDCVKQIRLSLQHGLPIMCGNIGTLTQDSEANLIFRSSSSFVHPTLFGLTNVYLQPLDIISYQDTTSKKHNKVRYTIGSVAAVAAAVLLFIIPSANVGETSGNTQKAGFLNNFTRSMSTIHSIQKTDALPTNTVSVASTSDSSTIQAEESKPARTYYIIIGGEEYENQAKRLLDRFQAGDFPNAAIVKSDRYRIYIASYNDKSEAERSLDIFRLENPKYATAWLYSKKNY